jgi:hypothetical protein
MSDFLRFNFGIGYSAASLEVYPAFGAGYSVGSYTASGSIAPSSSGGGGIDVRASTVRLFPVSRPFRLSPTTDLRSFPLD